MLVEEAAQRCDIALADFAQQPAHGLVNEGVLVENLPASRTQSFGSMAP